MIGDLALIVLHTAIALYAGWSLANARWHRRQAAALEHLANVASQRPVRSSDWCRAYNRYLNDCGEMLTERDHE